MTVSDEPSASSKRKLETTTRTKGRDIYDDDRGGNRRSKRLKRNTCPIKIECNSDGDESDNGNDSDSSYGSEGSIDEQSYSRDFNDESNNAVSNGDITSPRKKKSVSQDQPNSNAKRKKSAIQNRIREGKGKGDQKAQPKELKKALKCPYCGKNFQTSRGLQYHIEKLVCREEDGAKKNENTEKARKAAHEVGDENQDRTCPHCKRIFKSMNGMRYHVEQKVCRRASQTRTGDGRVQPFPTLHPGQKFVTPFGVVEVLKDDRAVPTVLLPTDVQDQFRKYKKSQHTEHIRKMGRYTKRSGKLRVRRNAINSLYQKGKANRRSIFEAYFGGDPEHIRSVIEATKAIESGRNNPSSKNSSARSSSEPGVTDVASTLLCRCMSDPREPKCSFPDRVVECKWIIDHRSHVLGIGRPLTKELVKRDAEQTSKKLYLQRKLLNQPYDELDRVYYCPDCGRKFSSSQSRKAHCLQKKCLKESRVRKEKRKKVQRKIELEMQDCIRFPERRKFVKNKKATPVLMNGKPSKWKKKKKPELSYYPELILALGFKLVKREKNSVNTPAPKPPSLPLREHGPDHILDDLKGVFEVQMRKASDQKHGSIYAEVYKALGFKNPRKRKGAKVGNNVGERKRRKRNVKPKPSPPPKPLPPVIDVRALVDEIKSGRYPSIKVFQDDHADKCVLCRKTEGKMFCCKFCNNVEHFKCILSKFTIKEPEPDEDFMCHKCIGVILSRRARAEKRRLRKQANNEKLKREQEIAERENSDGNEYPYMASQAREVNELVELLKDSQIRLRRTIETNKLNNIRRQVISGVYPDFYSKPY